MPTTVTALAIIVFAIVPGVLGETVYRLVVGNDWRQSEWERVVRIVTLSVGGLVFTSLILLMPRQLPLPTTFSAISLEDPGDIRRLMRLATGVYIIHFVSSSALGGLVALATRYVSEKTSMSTYPDSWDVFAKRYVVKHWVAVTLTDGTS